MSKIKHERTCDCVVAGYRVHKSGPDAHRLAAARPLRRPRRPRLRRRRSAPSRWPCAASCSASCSRWSPRFDGHPWNWAAHEQGERTPRKNETSRWNAGKDLSFVPLRPERVVEVRYDYMEGDRFRHTAQFVRWRPDRDPESCTYAQLERPVRFNLADVLTSG